MWVMVQTLLLAALLAAFLASSGVRPVRDQIGWVLGPATVLLGLGIAFRAFRDLGASFRVAPEPRDGAVLVAHGIYAVLRHPMYTAVILLAGGLVLLRPGLLVGLAAAALTGFYLCKARYEESCLRRRYPDYGDHVRRTFGVIPLRRGW